MLELLQKVTIERLNSETGGVIRAQRNVPATLLGNAVDPTIATWHIDRGTALLPPRKGDRIIEANGTIWIATQEGIAAAEGRGRFIVPVTQPT